MNGKKANKNSQLILKTALNAEPAELPAKKTASTGNTPTGIRELHSETGKNFKAISKIYNIKRRHGL